MKIIKNLKLKFLKHHLKIMNQDDSSSFVDRFLTSLQDPTMETILQNLKTLKIHYQSCLSICIILYFICILLRS